MSRRLGLGLLLALTFAALALRLPHLDRRPLHNDEAVNATKLQALWQTGGYTYDPDEFHGPALHYFTLPFVWLSGARSAADLSDSTLRLAPVCFGAGLILLLALFADGLGGRATLWAALLTAISPAMVFYSRYFIHEMLLVFFTTLLLGAGWRWWQTRKLGWAALAGLGLGLMYATKETFVIPLAALAGALVLTVALARRKHGKTAPEPADFGPLAPQGTSEERVGERGQSDGAPSSPPRLTLAALPWKALLTALAVAAVVSLVLFTSGFTNWHGPLDSIKSYLPWLNRAGGQSPHIHPWYFYLQRLGWFQAPRGPVWSEGLIVVLGLLGMGAALTGRGLPQAQLPLARFLTFYTLGLAAAYSLIAYKTPWCLLGFLQPLILLAGLGAVALLHGGQARGLTHPDAKHSGESTAAPSPALAGTLSPSAGERAGVRGPTPRPQVPVNQSCGARVWWLRFTLTALLLLATSHLAWQAWRASYPLAADKRNPYTYAQTRPNLLELVHRVEGIARVHPDGDSLLVKVMAPESYWPLPWYLRQFKQVGWWDALPKDPYAPVVIASTSVGAALDDKSGKKWIAAGTYELRPGVYLELYVDFELWKKYVATLPRERED
jgi:uncharacterized protein (TIGR03663 family)